VRKISDGCSITLDFVRAISSQLVVIGHGISFCALSTFFRPPNSPWMQNIAVVIFFILSGFLITYSLFSKISKSEYFFGKYFVDRFSRIYAAFIPALIFVALLDYISIKVGSEGYRYFSAFNIKTFIGNILLLNDFPNFKIVTSFGSGRPFWTLAVEWWIYMFVGYLFFLFKRKRISLFNILFLCFLSIIPIYNIVGGRGNGLTLYWLFGSLVLFVWNSNIVKTISRKYIFGFASFFSILSVLRVYKTKIEYDPSFAFLLAFGLLFFAEFFDKTKFNEFVKRSIRFVANYSYTLYLIHYSVYDFLITHYGKGLRIFLIGFFVSNFISYFFGILFEVKLTKKVKKTLYVLMDYKY